MREVTLLITSGVGPKECAYAVLGIAKAYIGEAKKSGSFRAYVRTRNARLCVDMPFWRWA